MLRRLSDEYSSESGQDYPTGPDTTPTFYTEATAFAPVDTRPSGTPAELIAWNDEQSESAVANPTDTTGWGSSSASSSASSARTAPARKPIAKQATPAKTATKPPKKNNKPDLAAYEELFRANLTAYLASGQSVADQAAAQNYFLAEWQVFAADLAAANDSADLTPRSRGGSVDWWSKYYDPLTQSSAGAAASMNPLWIIAALIAAALIA